MPTIYDFTLPRILLKQRAPKIDNVKTQFVPNLMIFCQCFDRFLYVLPNQPKKITKQLPTII